MPLAAPGIPCSVVGPLGFARSRPLTLREGDVCSWAGRLLVLLVWLVGRFTNRPYGLAGGFIDGQVWVVDEGVAAVMGWLVVWLVCPSPPRASPANIASLVRVPLRSAKGTFAQLPSFPRRRESRGRCKRGSDSETVS